MFDSMSDGQLANEVLRRLLELETCDGGSLEASYEAMRAFMRRKAVRQYITRICAELGPDLNERGPTPEGMADATARVMVALHEAAVDLGGVRERAASGWLRLAAA